MAEQLTIYILSTCSEGAPCFPQVFTDKDIAEKALLDALRLEWESAEIENDVGPIPFPDDAAIATDELRKNDPTYEPWELTVHRIAVPDEPESFQQRNQNVENCA